MPARAVADIEEERMIGFKFLTASGNGAPSTCGSLLRTRSSSFIRYRGARRFGSLKNCKGAEGGKKYANRTKSGGLFDGEHEVFQLRLRA